LILATPYTEHEARFSPNGKWVAYESNESGKEEIYIMRSDQPGKLRVSTSGGESPVWRRDGKELFFVARREFLVSSEVKSEAPLEVCLHQERCSACAAETCPGAVRFTT
jgi:Tol biopolymer transport system component